MGNASVIDKIPEGRKFICSVSHIRVLLVLFIIYLIVLFKRLLFLYIYFLKKLVYKWGKKTVAKGRDESWLQPELY